jgi:hypothetical protein
MRIGVDEVSYRKGHRYLRVDLDKYRIERFASHTRDFQHPVIGRLTLEQHQLSLEDVPGVQLVAYTAVRGSASERRLKRLQG